MLYTHSVHVVISHFPIKLTCSGIEKARYPVFVWTSLHTVQNVRWWLVAVLDMAILVYGHFGCDPNF